MTAGMIGIALSRGYGWIRDTLEDDAALTALGHNGIYAVLIPEGTSYPVILIQHAPGPGAGPIQVVNGVTIYRVLDYRVSVIVRGFDPETAVPLMDRIDVDLHGAVGTNDGVRFTARHTDEFDLPEQSGFYRIGKTYRLAAEDT